MDGTIVDSSAPVLRQWKLWADRNDIEWDRVLSVMHGRRAIETMQIVAPHLPQPETADAFLAVESLDTDGITEIPGAARFLAQLEAKQWAVVTSAIHDMARSRMACAGLPQVDVLVTADRVKRGKPDPEAFLLAAEELGVDPAECLVLEDSPFGIEAGRAAGMACLGVLTHYQCADLKADGCIRNYSQLSLQKSDLAGMIEVVLHDSVQ